jgi:hypothetical protein
MTLRAISNLPSVTTQQTLFVVRGADMTLTTDQAFTKLFSGTNYIVTNVFGVRKTGAFGTACLGGIYSAASKGGDTILAATQSWAALTGAGTSVAATLANILQTKVESATPFLSLTTGNTGTLTADIFILGVVVD